MKAVGVLGLGLMVSAGAVLAAERNIPQDLSKIRGFNYQAAWSRGVGSYLPNYNPADTEFDLDLAKRLDLNQVRVFLGFNAYQNDKETFRKTLLHLVRACRQRGIGLMPVLGYPAQCYKDKSNWPLAEEYAAFLAETLAGEPGLAFWDVSNEPDNNRTKEWRMQRFDLARHMAGVLQKLDPKTPVTIGVASELSMEALGDAVDVLSYHDYKPTRGQIRANTARAKEFAAKLGKPLICTEIGCIGRANPYDVALQEHMNAGVGWYIWELMITKNWGAVHGVFYPDGTVRDPSIVAALLGFFRNRGSDIVLSVPDQEGRVTQTVNGARKWLNQTDGTWEQGLDLAETAANLMEAGELVPMRELPTRQVDLMRQGQPDLPALHALLEKYISILEPYEVRN